MIKYSLICKECNLSFESWFASSSEFEKLKKKQLLNCHKCNSLKVDKNLMAPSINKKLNIQKDKELKKLNKIKKTIKEYQNFIKNNFDYVGENFAYEARSILITKTKKNKGIYGTASEQDLRDLSEEGIEIRKIPWIKDNDN